VNKESINEIDDLRRRLITKPRVVPSRLKSTGA